MIRPMLLAYIDDLIEDNTKKYIYTFEIYDELVSKWIEREPIEDISLYKFSEKVAEHMYYNKTMYINKDKIEDLCKESNIQLKAIEAKSKSLLNRNANGTYKFAHKSILEFFIAKKAYNDFKFRRTITFDYFKIFNMAKFFLTEMDMNRLYQLYINNPFELKGASFSFSQLSGLYLPETNILECDFRACNFTRAYFSGSKFKSVNLGDATFVGAKLTNTVLEGENLSFADLTRADLEGADLRRANLMGSRLMDANLKGAKLKDANLENSCWKKEDIIKAYSQLKESIFTQIKILNSNNNFVTIGRSLLFP